MRRCPSLPVIMEADGRIDMDRIAVVANNELVPLFPGRSIRDRGFSPWKDCRFHELGPLEVPEHVNGS